MSVVFTHLASDPCDLQWISTSVASSAVGLWFLTHQSQRGGEWIAWSITTADGSNSSITISVAGQNVVGPMGATDGTIYSPANLPKLAPNEAVLVGGTAGNSTNVFFNVLMRRS